MTILAVQKTTKGHDGDELKFRRPNFRSERPAANAPSSIPPQAMHAEVVQQKASLESIQSACSCSAGPAYKLFQGVGTRKEAETAEDWQSADLLIKWSVHTIPARRTICHPKEWSEFVTVICQGWAVSSITLSDGRRQILSFLLPGDFVSAASLVEPISDRSVEAVTEVTYRKFKRSDFKALLVEFPDLTERLSTIWLDERAQADQLALDLGRRTADERIARLILNLMERLAMRGMVNVQTMEFPLRQRHIADATGLTPVHVSKVLGEFQRADLIEINNRSLIIKNEKELRRTADWR